VKDCVNGHDEDKDYCDVSKVHAGLSFSGWFTEGSCAQGSRRNMYFCQIRITSIKRNRAFGSLRPMTMTSTCTKTVLGLSEAEQKPVKTRYSATGNYQIANRKWYSESGGYRSNCHFPDDTFDVLRCETYMGLADRCNSGAVIYRDD
jgi:hypothetical protein